MKQSHSILRRDIMEEARAPQHFGKIVRADAVLSATNPTCGDEMTLYLKIDHARHKIIDATFTGRGCMVMMASASRFAHALHGKSVSATRRMSETDALKIFAVPLTPSRETCALMPFTALKTMKKTKR